LQSRRGRGFTRGTLIHRWLQEVVWLEDFALGDADLDALGRELERDPDARVEALAAFRAALAQPEPRALLTRAAAKGPGDPEVWRERDFAEVVEEHGEQVLWTGSFDRVVLWREEGRVVRAEVIDWKTDRIEASAVDDRTAFYAPQIESYRRALARMTGLEPSAVTARLAFLEAGVVRRVEPSGA